MTDDLKNHPGRWIHDNIQENGRPRFRLQDPLVGCYKSDLLKFTDDLIRLLDARIADQESQLLTAANMCSELIFRQYEAWKK